MRSALVRHLFSSAITFFFEKSPTSLAKTGILRSDTDSDYHGGGVVARKRTHESTHLIVA